MDESTVTTTNGHATKQWPERTCGRCRKKFQPATARERRCEACTKAAAEQPKRARGKMRAAAKAPRRGNGFAQVASAADVTTAPGNGGTWKPGTAPAARVLNPDQIATAAELLTLAGYTVESIRTPAGEFLRVT